MAVTQPRDIVQGPHNDTYVIHFDLTDSDLDEAIHDFEELCADLVRAGLTYQIRPGEDQSLLIFACAPKPLLRKTIFQSRLKDYLYGITNSRPPLDDRRNGTPAACTFEAEDLLSVYHLVSWPASNKGAGITPGLGKWQHRVSSIFPLHNSPANKALLAKLSKRLFLRPKDLDSVRDLFGAKVAFYFAYMQTYFLFLFFPALTGVYTWAFLPAYSFAYAVVTLLGCVVFIEYWKIQQDRLSVRWDVRGVGHVKINRAGFRYDSVTVDSKSGKEVYHYTGWKLVARQLLQVPFFLAALGTLGVIISMVFALEVLVSEVYDGVWKSYLEYLPTVVLAIGMPYINTFLEDVAVQLAEQENHRTQDGYELSASQKMFMLSFISNYLPILLTAFVYVPLGDVIVPQLQLFLRKWLVRSGGPGAAAATLAGADGGQAGMLFHRDPDRLRNEVIALTVTGQVSDMFEEMIVPYMKHRLRAWWRAYKLRRRQQQRQRQNDLHERNGGDINDGSHYNDIDEKEFLPKPLGRQETLMLGPKSPPAPSSAASSAALDRHSTDLANHHHNHHHTDEEESTFLARARYQSTLPAYNVQDDLSEMVIQFGYLALFSPAWPLISVGFLVNNWIELRSDFLKICVEHQRPHPTRSDGIGSSWIDALDALALLGSISTGAIVHLFGGGSGGCAGVDGCVDGVSGAGWLSGRAWLRTIFQDEAGTAGMPSWWSLPVTIFISEHIFLVLRGGVRVILRKAIGSDIVRHEREDRYARRQRQWEDLVREADAAESSAEKDGGSSAVCGENESLADTECQLAADHEAGVQIIQELLKSGTLASGKTKKL